MRWTCPKCGKKINVSDERLIAIDGLIVCPNCGLQAQQPLPKSSRKSTPRAHAMKSSSQTPSPSTAPRQETPPQTPTRPKKKAKKKKKQSDGISSWGCLLRSVIFTLVLFAAYVFFGLLLDAMQ